MQQALRAEKVPLKPAFKIVHVAAKSVVIVFFKSAIAVKVPFVSTLMFAIVLKVPLKSAAKIDHVCWNSEFMFEQHALSAEKVPLNPAFKIVHVAAKSAVLVVRFESMLKGPLNPEAKIVHVC